MKKFNWNYLRMRGEYVLDHVPPTMETELPPHARRIPGRLVWCANTPGTTSACAENTRRIRLIL